MEARFTCCDFRRYAGLHRIPEGSLTLVITNPPLGRRVRVPGLRGLFDDLFATAARMLRPEGRLVLTNPFRMESPERSLQLESRRTVDLGGFDCRLEVYRKAPARPRSTVVRPGRGCAQIAACGDRDCVPSWRR